MDPSIYRGLWASARYLHTGCHLCDNTWAWGHCPHPQTWRFRDIAGVPGLYAQSRTRLKQLSSSSSSSSRCDYMCCTQHTPRGRHSPAVCGMQTGGSVSWGGCRDPVCAHTLLTGTGFSTSPSERHMMITAKSKDAFFSWALQFLFGKFVPQLDNTCV